MTVEESDPQKELLYEKLSELPDDDQELYRRYYIEEYSQEEIEKMKGVSQNTIFKKLRRIINRLVDPVEVPFRVGTFFRRTFRLFAKTELFLCRYRNRLEQKSLFSED